MSRLKKQIPELFIIILCFLTRMPQLLSNTLILDGDECVTAIMAKHIMQGKGLPLFFYGQHYGLTILECLFILPFYWLLGISALAVKLGMLSLWTTGGVFFYKAIGNLTGRGKTFGWLIVLVLITTPAWAVWSIKARGGYVTAFTLSSIVYYLLSRKAAGQLKWLAIGILTALLFESQALWLVAIAPILGYKLYHQGNTKAILSALGGIVLTACLFYVYKQTLPAVYSPPVLIPSPTELLANLLRIPAFLYSSLHGYYFFFFIQKPGLFAGIHAICFTAIILYLFVTAIRQTITKTTNGLFIAATGSVLLLLLATVFSQRMEARYLLPVSASVLFALAVLPNNSTAKWQKPVLTGLSVLGLLSLVGFKEFVFTQVREKSFREMLDDVQAKGIHHSFCLDPQLCWEILFYSNEGIVCRELKEPGRYPPYNMAVDSAINNGGKTAVVGYEGDYWGMDLKNVYNMNGFYICPDPEKETLKMHFRF